MFDRLAAGRPRLTRFQMVRLVLIPVIGWVLYSQVVARMDVPDDPPALAAASPTRAEESAAPARRRTSIVQDVRAVEEIAADDPLVGLAALLPEETEAAGLLLDEVAEPEETAPLETWEQTRRFWETQRVSVVLRTADELLAVVGDRTVRVGDTLEGGVCVVDIGSGGILLEETFDANTDEQAEVDERLRDGDLPGVD